MKQIDAVFVYALDFIPNKYWRGLKRGSMKLIIIMDENNNNCELAIPSRELSPDELNYIYQLANHNGKSVHYIDALDKTMPFNDISNYIYDFLFKQADAEPYDHGNGD